MTGGPQDVPPAPRADERDARLNATDLKRGKFVRDYHQNISSDVILITEDKALICLIRNFDAMRDRDAWKVPAGILTTLATVMLTAAPQDKFGITSETWAALGWISTLITALWLGRDLLRLGLSRPISPRSIVEQLKKTPGSGTPDQA